MQQLARQQLQRPQLLHSKIPCRHPLLPLQRQPEQLPLVQLLNRQHWPQAAWQLPQEFLHWYLPPMSRQPFTQLVWHLLLLLPQQDYTTLQQ
jgi:hypothetical protein